MTMGIHDTDEDDLNETHDINVTPFIDVILVLLIIFMVAAPLATVQIKVDLPSLTTAPQPKPEKPVYLTLRQDLTIAVGEMEVARDDLVTRLDAAAGSDHETRIFLRADKGVSYGDLMTVIDALRIAGYLKVALVGLEHP